MPNIIEQINESISLLDNWITQNGWAGYDPYDIQCSVIFHRLSRKNNFFRRLHGYIFRKSNNKFPRKIRRFLKVKPQINPKAMGLFTEAYSILYQETKKEDFLNKAKFIAQWLLDNPNKNYSNLCWGYPFDWQSKMFFPKGTPSGVATTAIGRGFWELYQITKDKQYLEACQSICKFIIEDLNIYSNKNGICFSYTPLDDFQVHNANLFAAEFLVKIGKATKNNNWIERGIESANFSIAEQNADGSLCYWSEESRKKLNLGCKRDHYHSGFEIRMLYGIWEHTKNNKMKDAANKYYEYYLENFFADDYAPILTPKGNYFIDVHSCAEALLLNSISQKYFTKSNDLLRKTANWIIKNMQTESGYFRYRLIKKRDKIICNNMPYLRWGQAWMLLGLSYTLRIFGELNG
jgi:rhamnogalacturonyl hydrolase YesR